MTVKYFKYPFGVAGDLAAIPNPTQLSGVVSYQSGFPIDYQLIDTDPSSLDIPRNQFNQLMFDTTSAIQQIQQNGFPIHITAAMNDGAAYAYDKNSYVRATDNNVYYSLIDGNVDVPPTANWQLAGSEVLQYFNFAADTGIADHYEIAPNPPVMAYADGDFILLRPIHANTGACDIDVNGLGVISIKTMTNQNPSAGMLIPTGAYTLIYFGGVFVLQNPTLGTAAYKNTGTANGNIGLINVVLTSATNGYEVRGPLTYQWGIYASGASPTTITFPIAFSGAAYSVVANSIQNTGGTGVVVYNITATNFVAYTRGWNGGALANEPFNWIAIGPT